MCLTENDSFGADHRNAAMFDQFDASIWRAWHKTGFTIDRCSTLIDCMQPEMR